MLKIVIEKIKGVKYYTVEFSGIIYTISYLTEIGEWAVGSRGGSTNRKHAPNYHYFKTLKDLESSIKCLSGISELVNATAKIDPINWDVDK